jgi:hypothetical protein
MSSSGSSDMFPVSRVTGSTSLATIATSSTSQGSTSSSSGLDVMEMQAMGVSIPKPPIATLEEQIKELRTLIKAEPTPDVKQKLSDLKGHIEKTVVSLHSDSEFRDVFLSNGSLKFGMNESLEVLGSQISKLTSDPKPEELKSLEGHVRKLSGYSKTLKEELVKGKEQEPVQQGKTAPEVLKQYSQQQANNTRGGRAFNAIKNAGNTVLSGLKEWFEPAVKNKTLAVVRVPLLALTGVLAIVLPLAGAVGGLLLGVLGTIVTGGVGYQLIPALTVLGAAGGAFLAWGVHSGVSFVLGMS